MDRPAVPPPDAKNRLQNLSDLQRALSDAALLGFMENDDPDSGKRPRRSGSWVAARLCVAGSYTTKHQRQLKAAYLAGYEMAWKKSVKKKK